MVSVLLMSCSNNTPKTQSTSEADLNKNTAQTASENIETTLNLEVVSIDKTDFSIGKYAIGTKRIYAEDPNQGFNDWALKYANESAIEFTKKMDALGEPHTIMADVWYPAIPGDAVLKSDYSPYSFYQAADGKLATYADYYNGHQELLMNAATSELANLMNKNNESLGSIAMKDQAAFEEKAYQFVDKYSNWKRHAYYDATMADGKFPVVVLAHGLGGISNMWNDKAELLASQGYIVIVPNFVSDGSNPLVFDNPNSIYAKQVSKSEISKAYEIIFQNKIVFNFFEYLYGIDLSQMEEPKIGNNSDTESSGAKGVSGGSASMIEDIFKMAEESTADSEGAIKATEMMGDLFQQRVYDIKACLNFIKTDDYFKNSIDADNIGVSGHSLGSITTEIALKQLDEVKTGLGLNNGTPLKWEPDESESVNITKPFGLIYGEEDDFLHMVFQKIWKDSYIKAGGDISTFYVLPDERADSTIENSDPILTATYNRALGPKMRIGMKDTSHDIMNPEADKMYPYYKVISGESEWGFGTKKKRMLNDEVFNLLSWVKDDENNPYHLAGTISDYYLLNWFDYYLKGKEESKEKMFNSPFNQFIIMQHESIQ